jgi:nitroreductase
MIKGSEIRQADYPIDLQFLDRWSPRALSGAEIPLRDLMTLLEAARWAPSSSNLQPWRMLYARRNTPAWPAFFDLLNESNKSWVLNAGALVLFVSHRLNEKTGQPAASHSFDTGAAWAFFALQGFVRGYVVHGMLGFDLARARKELGIPDDYSIEAMVAVGSPAPRETLPPKLQEREIPSQRRKLTETVFEGKWPAQT